MDKSPFLVINLLSLKDNVIPYLQRFEKSAFNVPVVTAKANELRYSYQIKQFLSKQLTAPDDSFIIHVMTDIYSGRKTQRVIEDFRPLVKGAFTQLISDKANEKLKSAMAAEVSEPQVEEKPAPVEVVDNSPNMERLETFFTVKTLIHDSLNGQALTYEDSKNQLEILFGGKWLCRFSYDELCLYINLKSGDKDEIKRKIRSADDVHLLQKSFMSSRAKDDGELTKTLHEGCVLSCRRKYYVGIENVLCTRYESYPQGF